MFFVFPTVSPTSVDEEEPKLYEEMHSPGSTTSGPVSFTVLAIRRPAIKMGGKIKAKNLKNTGKQVNKITD